MALPVVNSSRYSTKLPSTGVEIDYRPYLVKEEKIMMVALESKDNKQIVRAMKDVAQACVLSEVDVNQLTGFDLEWLFLKLRSKSVGENVELKLICQNEECKHPNPVNINLDEIEMDDFDDNRIIQLTDTIGLQMLYPSVDLMAKYDEEKLKTVDGAFDLIIDCMQTIYDEDNVYNVKDETRDNVRDFLSSLTSAQFKMVSDYLQNIPSVKKDVEYTCESCGKEDKLELRGLQSFFT